MEKPFILDPFNADFVDGKAKRPPDHLIGVVFAVIVLFLLPMAALNVLVLIAILTSDDPFTRGSILVMLVMLSVDAILFGAGWWFWRRFDLRRRGTLIDGEIIRVEGDIRRESTGANYVVTLYYKFESPQSGKPITGVIAQTRNDLADTKLPVVGEQVRVLYLHDKNYRVM